MSGNLKSWQPKGQRWMKISFLNLTRGNSIKFSMLNVVFVMCHLSIIWKNAWHSWNVWQLFCANFIKQPKEIERVLRNCPHYHLSELEINGFYGNHHEQVLLKYLLDNLVELKVLAVSPCQKVYSGFNTWVYEEANSWYKDRMESICDWLDAVVPPTVRLEIRWACFCHFSRMIM